jgi:hypothetical protein
MRRCRVPWARRGCVRLGVTALAALVLIPGTPAGAQTSDPPTDADRKVAEAQARANRAADAYFDALERDQELDREIASLRSELEQLDQAVARLRKLAVDRAVEAYKRAGTPFANTFGDADQVADVNRRVVLLEAVNQRDQDAADAFQVARADREQRQTELRQTKQAQAATLEQLEVDEERLNELLVTAQDERRVLAAQQAAATAAAAAAAAAAATPPSSTAPATAGVPTSPPSSTPASTPAATPTPSPAPPGYVPRAGTHPRHNDPFLTCTRQRESGGNYQAYNPAGPFYGAYQFLQSTWNATANGAGRGDLVGLDPRTASQYDQDDMAWSLYQWRGNGPWNGLC